MEYLFNFLDQEGMPYDNNASLALIAVAKNFNSMRDQSSS